jgi:hypothetical protein
MNKQDSAKEGDLQYLGNSTKLSSNKIGLDDSITTTASTAINVGRDSACP